MMYILEYINYSYGRYFLMLSIIFDFIGRTSYWIIFWNLHFQVYINYCIICILIHHFVSEYMSQIICCNSAIFHPTARFQHSKRSW